MSGKIRKSLDDFLIPPSHRKPARPIRRAAGKKTSPTLSLATRLLVAGAFVLGQPVFADPTPDVPVRTASAAFAALQDFVRTQRVVSLNLTETPAEPASSGTPMSVSDAYAALADFVRVADASGSVPLPTPPQAQAPKDAGQGARSLDDDYSTLTNFVTGEPSGSAQGQPPNDAIHAGLRVSTRAMGPAPDDAIHAGLRMSTAVHGPAPDDAIHSGLTASATAQGPAPDDAIHAGLHGSAMTSGDAYNTLVAFANGAGGPASAAPHGGQAPAMGAAESKPIVLAAAAAAPKPKKPVAEAVEAGPATYVGSQVCLNCHRSQYGNFGQTIHGQIFLHHPRDAQEKEGCEACHGPGSKHARTKDSDDIITFGKDSPTPVAERNAICLSCHERGDRTYWDGSVHQTRDLACSTCHRVMEKVSVKFLLAKSTEPEVCFQCHKDVRAKMVNSSHMPLLNGSVVCTSCHNPHGSATDGLLREASVNETCYKCHADKRGPFLWEHEPVRDNCLNCHDPHGSVNEYMLVMQRPRLCQSCHMGPGHGNPGNPMTVQSVNRSCQNCHTFVHGSNSPAGQLFQR
jgi:DmsE family decaheme c-type cytochrome